jgi:beta-lactamase regulating signal transducer with metallopeptidase domain
MTVDTFLNVTATTLLTYSTHSFVACVIALVVAKRLPRPQDRDLLWKTALVAPVFTAAGAILLSSFGGPGFFVDLANLVRGASHTALPERQVIVRVLRTTAGRDVFRQINDPVTTVLSTLAVAISVSCTSMAVVRFIRRRRALGRALAPRQPVATLTQTARGRAIVLTSAGELQSPVAVGSAEICLPHTVLHGFAHGHRDALIAHEVAHLDRRDPAWLGFAEIVSALSAFQPLIFLVTRAFRRDVELVCDEAAVRQTGDRAALIGALALLATPFDARAPRYGAATAYDGSPLLQRAERIANLSLGGATKHTRRQALFAIVALVCALSAVPVVSGAMRPSDIPIDPMHDGVRPPIMARRLFVGPHAAAYLRRELVLVH